MFLKREDSYFFLPVGIGIGISLGALMGNIGVGISIGVALGTIASLLYYYYGPSKN